MNGRGTTLPALKRELVHWCRKVWDRGWVANHDGNLTCRLPGRRYLATPTSFSKGEVGEDDLLILDRHGKKLQGRWRAFSELTMHLTAYQRDDVNAVLHAHPPVATAFAVAGLEINPTIIAEAVVSIGDRIPTIPYAMPGSEAQLETIAACLPWFDAIVLGNHGVITVGKDIEQAFLRMELVEHLARITREAMTLGGVRTIPEHDVKRLLEKRAKGGLGPLSRGVTGPPPL